MFEKDNYHSIYCQELLFEKQNSAIAKWGVLPIMKTDLITPLKILIC